MFHVCTWELIEHNWNNGKRTTRTFIDFENTID